MYNIIAITTKLFCVAFLSEVTAGGLGSYWQILHLRPSWIDLSWQV